MEKRPYVEGDPPPPGWVLAEIQGDGLYWVNPAGLELGRREPDPNRLTEEQRRRIQAFKEVLCDLDPTDMETTLGNFSLDQDPDAEIEIWERITAVTDAELARRPEVTPAERVLIYRAALACSNVGEPTVGKVLSVQPDLKRLEDLERIVADHVGRSP